MPLQFMLDTLRDTKAPFDKRMAAARDAAPYVHPKLATVQHQGDKDNPLHHVIEQRIVDP